ncbi:MAG: hypothetical protein Q8N81_04095 [bacterium]|nr:hypothetical protein [bacterium]
MSKKFAVILILLTLFLCASFSAGSVSAARLAPGSVPQLEPLQPLPVDVQPSLKSNVQAGESAASAIPALDAQGKEPISANRSPAQNTSQNQDVTSKPMAQDLVSFLVIVLLVFLASTLVYIRFNRGGRKGT